MYNETNYSITHNLFATRLEHPFFFFFLLPAVASGQKFPRAVIGCEGGAVVGVPEGGGLHFSQYH